MLPKADKSILNITYFYIIIKNGHENEQLREHKSTLKKQLFKNFYFVQSCL